ncbi:MAG TPA: hypothetical protein VGH15_05920 [Caulobacteraceae bacterium]|jgi:hypothetical protein
MDHIHAEITGARNVEILFERFPDDLHGALYSEIHALAEELLARVEAATPSRTGRLRSQERARMFDDKNRIAGVVDIAGEKGSRDFGKASALEYGAHRPTKVKAHKMRLDHAWGAALNAPMTVLVDAYTRTPDIAEHAFERGPLAAMQGEIFTRLGAVVDKAAAKAGA